MPYLMAEDDRGIVFLKFGEWTISRNQDPVTVTLEQVDEMVAAIGDPKLRTMIGANGESQWINADAHRVAGLSNVRNEAIVEFTEFDMDWKHFEPKIGRCWIAHIRLHPPMVSMKKVTS